MRRMEETLVSPGAGSVRKTLQAKYPSKVFFNDPSQTKEAP
jgi:hypothetical protein